MNVETVLEYDHGKAALNGNHYNESRASLAEKGCGGRQLGEWGTRRRAYSIAALRSGVPTGCIRGS